jgi:PAS domain-containing protein
MRLQPLPDDVSPETTAPSPLRRWSVSVAEAHDPCLILNRLGQLVSFSDSARDLLHFGDSHVLGRPLIELLELVDFRTGQRQPDYVVLIPPLVALSDDIVHTRNLLRIRHRDGTEVTVDTTSAAIRDATGSIHGSFTYFMRLGR